MKKDTNVQVLVTVYSLRTHLNNMLGRNQSFLALHHTRVIIPDIANYLSSLL